MQALPFALLAMILYLGAASWQGLTLVRRVPSRPALVRGVGAAALLCHALVIVAMMREADGLWLGLSSSAAVVSAVITAVLLGGSMVKPIINVATALFPLAAASLLLAVGLPAPARDSGLTPGIALHVISSALAFAVLAIAAVQAVLVGLQNQALRHHHIRGLVQALPPLTTMERVLFELIWAGMLLLTLSIASGFVFLDNLFAQHLAHKTILSLAAWVLFAILLAGRHFRGWRGLRAVRWTLGGTALLLLAYFGSRFVLEIVFQRG
ncbi:cytochrome C biogenesis protein [Halomonas sp. 1513]|nr:cytochrome c biogenesis protein CcsA [Halomonas sp. 1513]APX91801.1 cytochrome C biogenesis protein [Halomonas sp. 1513]